MEGPLPVYYAKRLIRECCNPYCHDEPGHGRWRLFCQAHADELGKIAEMIMSQGKNMHNGAMDPRAKNKKRRRRNQGPTCCSVGCENPRLPPSAYCDTCVSEGAFDYE